MDFFQKWVESSSVSDSDITADKVKMWELNAD